MHLVLQFVLLSAVQTITQNWNSKLQHHYCVCVIVLATFASHKFGTIRVGNTGWAKKWDHRLMATTLWKNLNLYLKKNFTERFLGKFVVKWLLKIPPHLAYVATLPCDTSMAAKQAINDKLQGSVATYLRCSGNVNNQIMKGLLLSLRIFFKSVNIWQSFKQERDVSCTFFVL